MSKHPEVEPEPLRERTRRAVAAEIGAIAMKLFRDHGFDATTIDQIAVAAGISRRTFFRYFETKEDALAGFLATQDTFYRALAGRPATEDAWTAMTETLRGFARTIGVPGGGATIRLIFEVPKVRARYLERLQTNAHTSSITELEKRLRSGPRSERPIRAAAIFAAGVGAFDVSLNAWVASGCKRDLSATLEEALGAIRA